MTAAETVLSYQNQKEIGLGREIADFSVAATDDLREEGEGRAIIVWGEVYPDGMRTTTFIDRRTGRAVIVGTGADGGQLPIIYGGKG